MGINEFTHCSFAENAEVRPSARIQFLEKAFEAFQVAHREEMKRMAELQAKNAKEIRYLKLQIASLESDQDARDSRMT